MLRLRGATFGLVLRDDGQRRPQGEGRQNLSGIGSFGGKKRVKITFQ